MTTLNPDSISTKGFTKAQVLSALWNKAKSPGDGKAQSTMTTDEAEQEISRQTGIYFDTVRGRHLKVELNSEGILDPTRYDQNNGAGCAKRALESLKDWPKEPTRMAG